MELWLLIKGKNLFYLSLQNVQPSPLALLAATCSRIGDTLHATSHPVFTQKNLTNLFEKRIPTYDNDNTRSCAFENNINNNAEQTTSTSTTITTLLQHPSITARTSTIPSTSSSIGGEDLGNCTQPTETLALPNNHIFSTTNHQQSSSCLKVIKTEQALSTSSSQGNSTLDLNQNYTESMHICPNIVNEPRMLDSQPRASFTRCSHDTTSPHSHSSCEHHHQQALSPNNNNNNNNILTKQTSSLLHYHQQQQQQHHQAPSCHENITTLSHIPTSPNSNSSSSCLYQGGTQPQQQQHQQLSPSCGMTTLSHFSMSTATNNSTTNNNLLCDNSSYGRTTSNSSKSIPSINPWQNQTVNRIGGEQQSIHHKSQCMVHENSYSTQQQQQTSNPTQQQQHSSTHIMPPSPQERAFRTYSPPGAQQDRQFTTGSFRSPEYGPPSVESHHSSQQHYTSMQSPHQQQTFDGYGTPTSFENTMDIKPDPYTLQNMRNASSMSYDTHAHNMNTPPDHTLNVAEPALQNPHYLTHGHPSLNYGTGYPGGNFASMHQSPDLVTGAPPMAGPPDMIHQQNYIDYQYQQQMFYSRENRRPRRIACTCPNCRDGENKTVTTKDGKQRKLHVCHILGCGKEYGKTSHLRAHLRWHAGERPFACNWLFCNKRFTRSDELQRHRRTHTGDKRFECSVCMKKFMRSDHLSKHMKTHQSQQSKQNNKDKGNNDNQQEKNNNKASKATLLNKQQQSDLEKSKFMNSLGLPNSLNLQ